MTAAAGKTIVVFDNSTNNTSWQLTGQNSGTVSGAGVTAAFQNVENLTSGTANANTLTVEQGGTLSGVFDGGAGQNNSLLLNTWEHQSAEASIGPQYDTITLDGQAYNYTDVQNVNIGDPTEMEFNATLGGTVTGATITMEANSGGGFNFISSSYNSGDNSQTMDVTPDAGSQFEVYVGSGNSLIIDGSTNGAIDFSSYNTSNPTPFLVDGGANNVEIKGAVSDSAGVTIDAQSITIDANASITGGTGSANGVTLDASVSSNYADNESYIASHSGAPTITTALQGPQGATPPYYAFILENSGATISANTIALSATSATIASITTDGTSEALDSATITTFNSATITIDGTVEAVGAHSSVSAITNVNLTDTVMASDGENVSAISIAGTDTSEVVLSSAASVSGGTVDLAANTSVNVTIAAGNLANSFLEGTSTFVPPSATSSEVEVTTDITNTTEVTVPTGAVITQTGSGTIGTTGAAVALSATDNTTVTTTLSTIQTAYLPIFNGVLVYATVDSANTFDRTTEVTVGNTASTTEATSSTTPIISAVGDVDLTATSGGDVQNIETSDSIGTGENNVGSSPNSLGDTTLVQVQAVNIEAGGVDASATASTTYLVQSHVVSNTVYGETEALVDYSYIGAGLGGLTIDAQDNSALTAIGESFDIDTESVPGIDTIEFAVTESSAVNTFDKNVEATLSNSIAISGGEVTVEAVNNTTIVAYAQTETITITTTILDKARFSVGGTFAANTVLGQTSASIAGSAVTTQTADATGANPTNVGDVQVLAGDTSVIDSDAEAGAISTGGATNATASENVAVNVIGWTGASSLQSATINGLLGTDFWTTETPSNVTATITGSQITAAGALVLMALANGTVNATVSNVSQSTGSATGGSTSGATGGVVATNKLSRQAQAYINNTGTTASNPISAGGAVSVTAQDNETINSNSTLITSADAVTTGLIKIAQQALAKVLGYVISDSTDGGIVQLNNGAKVILNTTYSTSRSLFAPLDTAVSVTVTTGQTVLVSKGYPPNLGTVNTIYVYTGLAPLPTNLEDTDFNGNDWTAVSGNPGSVYEFMGANGTWVNLGTGTPYITTSTGLAYTGSTAPTFNSTPSGVALATMEAANYTNLNYWYQEPYSQLLPTGYNIKAASAIGVGGIVILNSVDGGATAYILSTDVSAGSVTVAANDNAAITAITDVTATASGGSAFGSGTEGSPWASTVLAVNATITANQVIGTAIAYITDSSVTTTDTAPDLAGDVSPDVSVTALNSDTITANTQSSVTATGNNTGTAVGIILAFNSIGAEVNNILSLAVNAILAANVAGSTDPAVTSAYIQDSNISSAGNLTVSANSTEAITSTIGNNTTSDAMAFANASGYTAAVSVSSNEVHAGVTAYIDNDNSTGGRPSGATIVATKAALVSASDNSSVNATSQETTVNTPTNDGGGGLINSYANLVLDSYQYTDKSGTQTLNYGDKVWVSAVTVNNILSIVGQGSENTAVANGDLVEDAQGNFWQYDGSSPGNYNFSSQTDTQHPTTDAAPNFNDGNWTEIGNASQGTIYEFMGPGGTTDSSGNTVPGTSVNLSTLSTSSTSGYNFGNVEYWKPLTQNNIMQAAEADVVLGVAGEIMNNDDIFGNTIAAYALMDFNNVQSSTTSYVQNATVTQTGSLSVNSTDAASITANNSSVVTTGTIGANNGGGDGFGGVIATNQVDGDALAYIDDASVTTTTGDVDVEADNTAFINATETTILNSGGKSISLLAAFNVIGYSSDSFLGLTVDALLGDSSLLGNETPDATLAYITNSTVTAGGSVNVTATDSATITVDAGDSSTAANSSNLLFSFEGGPSSLNAGGLLATNMVATTTNAYIDSGLNAAQTGLGSTTVTATTGSINVSATDQSSDTATSILNLSAVTMSNEQDLVSILDQLLTTSYAYTNESGWQLVNPGDEVFAGFDPSTHAALIYTFNQPTSMLLDLGGVSTDPSPVNFATSSYFTLQTEGEPTLTSVVNSVNLGNLTTANAKGVGFIFVLNNVSATANATIVGATAIANSGGISVTASESAAINAFAQNNITSSGGSSGITPVATADAGKSGSLALSGSVVTNLVNSSATADVDRATYNTAAAPGGLGTVAINPGDTVQLENTSGEVVGSGSSSAVINPGDVVLDGSTLYAYNGLVPLTLDLSSAAAFTTLFTIEPGVFTAIQGTLGAVYQYQASTPTTADLYTINYTASPWKLLTAAQAEPTLSAGTGGISVNAANAAQLNAVALVASGTTGGGDQSSIGLVLAFNALGYDAQNFLFNSMSSLLGENFATPDPSNATAYIHDTNITQDYGDLDVEATSSEQVNATNSNAAITTASALFDANGDSFGGSLANNDVDGNAIAYIDESDLSSGSYQITIGGSLNVDASNDTGIYSNVKLVSSSTVTNDGGAGVLNSIVDAATPATYTTTPSSIANPPYDGPTSHVRGLVNGDTVSVAQGYDTVTDTIGAGTENTAVNPGDVVDDNGTLYRYIGSAAGNYNMSPTADTTNPTTDSIPNFTDTNTWAQIGGTAGDVYQYMGPGTAASPVNTDLYNTNYTNLNLWKPVLTTDLVPQGLNVTDSNATAAGGILVLNDVESATTAYVTNVKIATSTIKVGNVTIVANGGTISINAVENATLSATNDSTVTNSGGSALAAGSEYSGNGVLATNLVQSSAKAYSLNATLTSNSALYVLGSGGTVTINPGDVVEEPASSAAATFSTTPSSGDTNVQTVATGDTVQLGANYDAATDTVGSNGPDTQVNPGDVVLDGTTLYRYVGSSAQVCDLTGDPTATAAPNFSDSTTWAQIGGTAGAIYQYVGTAGSVDLNNTDYTNTADWQLVQPALYRYVGTTALTGVSLAAGATPPNFASETGGNPNWAQTGLATISIDASNTSAITASNSANTGSGGKGGGVVLAFNTLGYQSQNWLASALDTLLGAPGFATDGNADVSAYAQNSVLDASAGSIAVEATEQAQISATTSNATSSVDSGLANEDGSLGIGAILANNMINADADAYITTTSTAADATAGGGGISVVAQNNASITASNDQVVIATAISSPQTLLATYLGNAINDYQYTSSSGTQSLSNGDEVYDGFSGPDYTSQSGSPALQNGKTVLAPNGIVYEYTGTGGTFNLANQSVFTSANGFSIAYYTTAYTTPVTLSVGDLVIGSNGEVYRYDVPTDSPINLSTISLSTSDLFDPNIYIYSVTPDLVAATSTGNATVQPNQTVLGADGYVYQYTGSTALNFTSTAPLSAYNFDSASSFTRVTTNLGTTNYSDTSTWQPLTYSILANLPVVNITPSSATAVGAMFVLNDVNSTVSATVTNGALSAAGDLVISAQNKATIDADNTSTVTANGGSPFAPPGQGNSKAGNVTIASNYILASTIASATDTSLTTTDLGNVDITALGDESISAEMDSTTQANTSTIGIVLAFNAIGYDEVAGFLEGTVNALFGTDLGANPDLVEAYATNTPINAAGGVAITANDTSSITADVSNASLGFPDVVNGSKSTLDSPAGLSIGATIAHNAIDTNVEAYVSQTGTSSSINVTAGQGDIDIEASDVATIASTVVTPSIKIGISLTPGGSTRSASVSPAISSTAPCPRRIPVPAAVTVWRSPRTTATSTSPRPMRRRSMRLRLLLRLPRAFHPHKVADLPVVAPSALIRLSAASKRRQMASRLPRQAPARAM